MDYEKKYKEALERAKEIKGKILQSHLSTESCKAISEYIDTIIPELRESDDERIRKAIIYNLNNLNVIYNATKEECLAWLEKQKECHSDDVLNRTYQNGFEDGFKAGKEVERRNSSDNDFIKPRMQEPWNNEKQKEQKPIQFKDCNLVEIIKGEFEGFRSLLKKRGIDYQPTDSYWESFARLFDSSAREYLKEQKPVEWSEEDEANFKWFDKFFRAESVIANGRDIPQDKYLWFKSLRPQPKKEWSKKDKKILQSLHHVMNCTDAQNAVKRDGLNIADVCDFLFSVEPNWKPSKEQMDALRYCCKYWSMRDGYKEVLESLYNNLKKLM